MTLRVTEILTTDLKNVEIPEKVGVFAERFNSLLSEHPTPLVELLDHILQQNTEGSFLFLDGVRPAEFENHDIVGRFTDEDLEEAVEVVSVPFCDVNTMSNLVLAFAKGLVDKEEISEERIKANFGPNWQNYTRFFICVKESGALKIAITGEKGGKTVDIFQTSDGRRIYAGDSNSRLHERV